MKWLNRIAQAAFRYATARPNSGVCAVYRQGFNPGLDNELERPESTPNPADASRTRGAIPNWCSTPILPPATLRVAMRAGHHSAWPDSRTRDLSWSVKVF